MYACISKVPEYYQRNKDSGTALYTDNMIYSPRVPVIRSEDGNFLETPYFISILTAPAVNRGAIACKEPENLDRVKRIMDRRIGNVLKVAANRGHTVLVLGAWGCGVFDNDPEQIARLFRKNLVGSNRIKGRFDRIVFAVLDKSKKKKTLQSFERILKK